MIQTKWRDPFHCHSCCLSDLLGLHLFHRWKVRTAQPAILNCDTVNERKVQTAWRPVAKDWFLEFTKLFNIWSFSFDCFWLVGTPFRICSYALGSTISLRNERGSSFFECGVCRSAVSALYLIVCRSNIYTVFLHFKINWHTRTMPFFDNLNKSLLENVSILDRSSLSLKARPTTLYDIWLTLKDYTASAVQ